MSQRQFNIALAALCVVAFVVIATDARAGDGDTLPDIVDKAVTTVAEPTPADLLARAEPTPARRGELELDMSREQVHAILGAPTSTTLNGSNRTDTYTATRVSVSNVAGCGLLAVATAGLGLFMCKPTVSSTFTVTYKDGLLLSFTNPKE